MRRLALIIAAVTLALAATAQAQSVRVKDIGRFQGGPESAVVGYGVVMGLEFNHPEGAKYVMRHLYRTGVWAIFSTLDPRVLQYKPGLLMTPELSEELLERTSDAGVEAPRPAAPATSTA